MSAELAQTTECRLGRYVLRRSLGQGGNGQVFLAWKDNVADEPLVCVVKFPLQRFARSERDCERFLQEARLGMRLGAHPNIVHVIDVDYYYGMPIIAMQYLDGMDLDLLLKFMRGRRPGLSLAAIYCILSSLAAALHHAHCDATIAGHPVSIVHRDVKPANILVTRDGIVKLADFGIGVALEDGTSGNHWRGSTRYMSPEHLMCTVSPTMDVYSLGAVAWEMVENRPFRGDVPQAEIYAAIMDARIPPMRSGRIPRELTALIQSCLDPHPGRRPTAAEVRKALRNCPGYCCDPSTLQHELVPVIGPLRSSGASQEEPAATPELLATLAALQMQLEADSHCTTAARPAARRRVRRRPVKLRAVPDLEVDPETDAPRIFRRPRHRRLTGTREMVELAPKFVHPAATGATSGPSGSDEIVVPPGAEIVLPPKAEVGVEAGAHRITETLRKPAPKVRKRQEPAPHGVERRRATGQVRDAVSWPGIAVIVVISLLASALTTTALTLWLGVLPGGSRADRTSEPDDTTTTGAPG